MLKKPNLSDYNNGSFYAFFLNTLEILERSNEPTLTPYLTEFKDTVKKLEASYKLDRDNALTSVIAAADKRRDSAFSGIKHNVKSYEFYFEEEKQAAAALLLRNFKKYGNIVQLPYNQQTGLLRGMLRDWEEPTFAAAIATLNLNVWHNELKSAQTAFEMLYIDRAEAEGAKTALPFYKLRPDAVKVYNDLANLIRAFAQINFAAFEPIIGALNDMTQRFNEALEQPDKKEGKS